MLGRLVLNIGKEANRWEERHLGGPDEDTEIDYDFAPDETEQLFAMLRAPHPMDWPTGNCERE
jgi:hypothetical protein